MMTFACVMASIGTMVCIIFAMEGLVKLYDIIFKTGR